MSEPAWKVDKAWSDRCVIDLKRIAGEVLVAVAPVHLDQKQNTDLMVMSIGAQTIACRVRRAHYAAKYGFDITFRFERPSGAETEYEKMTIGQWGDLMIYGFADDLGHVFRWCVLSLSLLRGEAMRQMTAENRALRKRTRPPAPLTLGPVANQDGVKFVYLDARDSRVRKCIIRHSDGYFAQEAA